MGSSMSKTAVESNNSMNTTFDTTTTANNQINNETTQLSGEEYEILQQIQSSEAMPQYRRQETFQEKAFRKVRYVEHCILYHTIYYIYIYIPGTYYCI